VVLNHPNHHAARDAKWSTAESLCLRGSAWGGGGHMVHSTVRGAARCWRAPARVHCPPPPLLTMKIKMGMLSMALWGAPRASASQPPAPWVRDQACTAARARRPAQPRVGWGGGGSTCVHGRASEGRGTDMHAGPGATVQGGRGGAGGSAPASAAENSCWWRCLARRAEHRRHTQRTCHSRKATPTDTATKNRAA